MHLVLEIGQLGDCDTRISKLSHLASHPPKENILWEELM